MGGHFLPFLLELVIVFIIGASGGSFANVVALSYPDFRKILVGRSACPNCQHRLSWYELIPLISYVWQTGKCRSCERQIAPSYFWVELLTGTLFVSVYLVTMNVWQWWQVIILFVLLVDWAVIFIHDWHTMDIPDAPIWFAVLLTVLLQYTFGVGALQTVLLAGVGAYLFIALLRLIASLLLKQEAMGSADAYVAALVGLLVGLPNIYFALFASFVVGSVYGLILVYIGKKKSLQAKVPFAPALLIGGWLALLWGQPVINWYLQAL
ncbi:MAG: prepilin peptidase [bacterium]|nr:prepilin peptidase [bacterium]